ncbi:MAG: ATP-binding protein [Cyanothece sp. SIO2G6]|nr:ATP-binding protein [Cyanothece sp. SIO2G6]
MLPDFNHSSSVASTQSHLDETRSFADLPLLTLDSTVGDLNLYTFQMGLMETGRTARDAFALQPLLPGILLVCEAKLFGMISRQQFFSRMSQPYSLELFLKRPVKEFYCFVEPTPLILPQDTPISEAAQRALQRPTEYIYEPLVVQFSSSDLNYSLLDIHQLLLAQAEIHRLTTVFLDQKTQEYLYQTEKMSMLGQTMAGVAHEIKNPVNSINGNFPFLKDYIQRLTQLVELYRTSKSGRSSQIQSFETEIDIDFLMCDLPRMVESLDFASERLVDIVSSLRNFSRFDRDKQETVDIHKYLDGTLLILNSQIKQGINIVKNYGDMPASNCYPGQISQVFMNLLSNAVDALLEKQNRLLEQSKEQCDAVEEAYNVVLNQWQPCIYLSTYLFQDYKNVDHLAIKISDNADGIPEDIQTKIFEPFFTTKSVEKGTGLGLAISHQIITNHNGQIRLTSDAEVGTTFEIFLPVSNSEVATELD